MITKAELNLLKKHFEPDGSLHDIYIQATTKKDWDKFLEYAKNIPHDYIVNSNKIALPLSLESFWKQDSQKLLSLNVENIRINCHFFLEEEIELDVDPRDFKQDQDYFNFINFIKELGASLNKDIIVTGENFKNYLILRYDVTKNKFKIEI